MNVDEQAHLKKGIKIGEIDAFLSLCHHFNFTAAAEELGISAATVSRRVESLERSFQTQLLDVGEPMQLMPLGDAFITFAIAFVSSFDANRVPCPPVKRKRMGEARAKVSVADLERFVIVAEAGNYKRAAGDDAENTIRESVKKIEAALGDVSIVTGHGVLTLTDKGEKLIDSIHYMLRLLTIFDRLVARAYRRQEKVSPSWAPKPEPGSIAYYAEKIMPLRKLLPNYLRAAEFEIDRLRRSKRAKHKVEKRIEALEKQIANGKYINTFLVETFGPAITAPGKHVNVDNLGILAYKKE